MSNLISTLLAWLLVAIGLAGVALRTFRKPRPATAQAGPFEAAQPGRSRLQAVRGRFEESDLLQPERPAAGGSGFTGSGAARAASAQARVSESLSVVLRRQIPPRGEAPRSWLGGLPMLPDGVEWPRGVNPEKRDAGAVPLHFIAQIACADLPPDLWGGLGPRSGWLLLFLNNNTCFSDDPGAWRLIHTEELGSERQPPADIGPIHDGMCTGPSAWNQTNAVYPHWPVDLVKVGNTLRHEGQRSWPTPDHFEAVLYPGQKVQPDRGRLPPLPIYSRRVLRDALSAAIAQLRHEVRPRTYTDAVREQLAKPENSALILSVPRLLHDQANARFAAAEAEKRGGQALPPEQIEALLHRDPGHAARLNRIARLEELMAECPTGDALIARCEADRQAWIEWRGEVADWLEEWLASIGQDTLDQPLRTADRQRQELLDAAPPCTCWSIEHDGGFAGQPNYQGPRESETSAATLLNNAASQAGRDLAVEYYLDPDRRAMLPAEVLPQYEAWWRALYDNRPHRIGGYHDGVQSDAIEGPQDKLLLLQLATDYPMHFCWGDCGAVYAFIRPDDLTAGRFDAAEVHLECH